MAKASVYKDFKRFYFCSAESDKTPFWGSRDFPSKSDITAVSY